MSSTNSYPIKTALISVSDKTNIIDFARKLSAMNVHILSTGGTAASLKAAGINVQDVSDYTGFDEMMDGRVKTLHPKVHGGILARRDNAQDLSAMQAHGIQAIDMVVLNLYPFARTVANGADYAEVIENIDIGGPAMLRAAAKNHEYVTVVTSPDDYDDVLQAMQAGAGDVGFVKRQEFAAKAFAHVASYDAMVSGWFAKVLEQNNPQTFNLSMKRVQELRYGENPHQKAAFYITSDAKGTLATAEQMHGKELSYNNINDTDAAWCLVCELPQPSIAIIKHANPCGVATGANLLECYEKALKCDPQSAYGGIIAANVEIDAGTATEIAKLFAEVVIAPSFSKAALEILQSKKNVRLLHTHGELLPDAKTPQLRSVSGGVLVQDYDDILLGKDIEVVSENKPNDATMQDLIFAFAVAKHVKSNAIVLVKDGTTIGIGAGQMSRIDSVRISCLKAQRAGISTAGAVLASDAFFPFDDNVHQAAEVGIAAIIQPGGSIRDDEVIKAANQHNMALCFTGVRHFKH